MAGMAALPGLIRSSARASQQGEVESFDFSLLDDRATPNDLFFIRSHSPLPASTDTWTISICGEVSRPYELSLKNLRSSSPAVVGATVECDDNPAGGGLVSAAEWKGLSLPALLETAKPRPSARFVRLWGADQNYAQTVPFSKAAASDTIVALQMNGETLPHEHGGPVRVIVPGWYGTYSVKWLTKVELLAHDAQSPHLRRTRDGRTEPVGSMQVKSAFARPLDGAIITGRTFIVRGVAWTGAGNVGQVHLSTDGRSWQAAQLLDLPQHFLWTRWQWVWKIPRSGSYELLVQASDTEGHSQPLQRGSERLDDYEHNECQRVRVRVIWSG
jgi:DMSO/TMAO reductase YedYZ molybdopterin-dependent catalytic subunit